MQLEHQGALTLFEKEGLSVLLGYFEFRYALLLTWQEGLGAPLTSSMFQHGLDL